MLVKYNDGIINIDKILYFFAIDDEKGEFPFQIKFISEGDFVFYMRFLYADTRNKIIKHILDSYNSGDRLLNLDDK